MLTICSHAACDTTRRAPIARCKHVRCAAALCRGSGAAACSTPWPALLAHHRWLLLLSLSSLERSRVEFAPVRGTIGGMLAEWTLASAQGVRARGAATLHPIQSRNWPSEAASQQPWPKRALKQRRVRTSRFAGRRQSCRWARASTSESRHVGRPAMQQSSEAVRSSARLCA